MKRNATRAPWEVEEFDSTSGSGMVEIDVVVELDPVSVSVSPAEAVEAPSPPSVFASDVEQVNSGSRSEVEEVGASSSLRAYLALLCLAELRCRIRLELFVFCLEIKRLHSPQESIS